MVVVLAPGGSSGRDGGGGGGGGVGVSAHSASMSSSVDPVLIRGQQQQHADSTGS